VKEPSAWKLLRFEHRHHNPLPFALFRRRLMAYGTLAAALVIGSLLAGVAGYRAFEHMSGVDAFLNAAMIMSGMGPAGELNTTHGKIFASLYALYAGLVLVTAMGLLVAPVAHRILHRFHAEGAEHPTPP
jgi:hypothetical protein